MKKNSASTLINQLQRVARESGKGAQEKKERLLHKISAAPLSDPASIILYHDCLLYLLAYPENKVLFAAAEKELNRIAEASKEVFNGRNERRKTQLTNTGVANTMLNVSFSFDLVKWLEEKYPDHISIFSCDADEETIKSVFIAGLLKPEADRFREESFSLEQFIRHLKPNKEISDLRWLLNFLDQVPVSKEMRDHLYDSLKIFISVSLKDDVSSLTFGRSLPRKIFFHQNGLLKKFDAAKVIRDKKIKAYSISDKDKEEIVSVARMTLCAQQREIDPVTYAQTKEVELFDMGRGIDIALFPMTRDRRLSLESYIGYLAFKNRIPIAYGGGWIFLFHSKIGINIFPALRGGESSYLFCQILRLYHHHFNIKKFIVEPYQIGKDNMEGLKSGAYWFYYRFGFGSVKKELQELAQKEFQYISEKRNYRSPIPVMKKLATSNLELNLSPGEVFSDENAEDISRLVTDYINVEQGGSRNLTQGRKNFNWKGEMSERDFILQLQHDAKTGKRMDERFLELSKNKS